jgi:hypothetical protein
MIIPFITSREQLPRSFDALRSDVEDLITNLRNHCKTEPPPADALRLGPSLGVSIADFSLALSSGKIKNAWTDTKGVGLRSILIAEEEVRAMRIANLSGERLNTPQPPAPTFEYWKERANHFTPIN